jgi:hypothetical protein
LVRKGERQDTDQCNKGRWRYLWRRDAIYCILLTPNNVGQVSCDNCTLCAGSSTENGTQKHGKLNNLTFVIEGFRRGRNVAYNILGCYPASIFGVWPTFRDYLFVPSTGS